MELYPNISDPVFPDWSQLLPELLHLVMQSLPSKDFFPFGKVCKSWRSVFLERCCVGRPPICMILKSGTKQIQPKFWGLRGDHQLQKFRSPRVKLHRLHKIVGSSMGWLVIAHSRFIGLHLFNPISNKWILLPSRTIYGHKMCYNRNWPSGSKTFPVDHVNLSASPIDGSDCVLVVRGWSPKLRIHQLAWCKLGDPEWRTFDQALPLGFKLHMTMFHEGQLYLLGRDRDILICSFDHEPKIRVGFSAPTTYCTDCTDDYFIPRRMLVESCGEVLLVEMHQCDLTDDYTRPVTWNVFKEQEDQGWKQIESLDDRILFIGGPDSECFCTHDFTGSNYDANCIYYFSSGNLEKFSMAEKTVHRIPLPQAFEWVTVTKNDGTSKRVRIGHLLNMVYWIMPEM